MLKSPITLFAEFRPQDDPGPFKVLWEEHAYRYCDGFDHYPSAMAFAKEKSAGGRIIYDSIPKFMCNLESIDAMVSGLPPTGQYEYAQEAAKLMCMPAKNREAALADLPAARTAILRETMQMVAALCSGLARKSRGEGDDTKATVERDDSMDHPTLKCDVKSISYDFDEKTGVVQIAAANCTDMNGCIAFFEGIDPNVKGIVTISGDEQGTMYLHTSHGWVARSA